MAAKGNKNREENEKKTCFVIMPFSDPEGYEPGHFRSVYEYTFAPAIRAAGYEPLRIDDNIVSSLIHGKMMNELVTAPMVLCDLSTNNPNVLYELGIRHAFDLPVVLVQEIGQKRIFDIAGISSVEYHRSRFYEHVVEDQKIITEAIRQTANAKNKYSIMSLVAIHAAKQTETESFTQEDRLEYLLQNMSRIVNNLEKRIADTQFSMSTTKGNENREAQRKECAATLQKVTSEADDMLFLYRVDEGLVTLADIRKHQHTVLQNVHESTSAGVDSQHIDKALNVYRMLNDAENELLEKQKNRL